MRAAASDMRPVSAPDSGSARGDLAWRLVATADREVADEGEDAAQEQVARAGGPEPEAAGVLGLRHAVADRRAQRASQDVGQPEREDRVPARGEVRNRYARDPPAEQRHRHAVAEGELL